MNVHVVLHTQILKMYKIEETELGLSTSFELCIEHLDTPVQVDSSLFKNLTQPNKFTDLCISK
jgi:hypothetical protein